MNTDLIHEAFARLLAEKGVHLRLGVRSVYIRILRYRLSRNYGISTDLKLKLLQKSGWRQSNLIYSQHDLVEAVRFTLISRDTGLEKGAEYMVEKFLQKKRLQNTPA